MHDFMFKDTSGNLQIQTATVSTQNHNLSKHYNHICFLLYYTTVYISWKPLHNRGLLGYYITFITADSCKAIGKIKKKGASVTMSAILDVLFGVFETGVVSIVFFGEYPMPDKDSK